MARYYVLETEADAAALVADIDARGRQLFASAGFTIREDGAIVGKRDGVDDPQGVTTTWAIPAQRKDGKWVVPHIEGQGSANTPLTQFNPAAPEGVTVQMFVGQGITATVETASPDWWPSEE